MEKGLSLEGIHIMLRNTPDTLKEGKGEISRLYLFTTSSYVSCSCYCNNNPISNIYLGKVYNTKNVLIVMKMLQMSSHSVENYIFIFCDHNVGQVAV